MNKLLSLFLCTILLVGMSGCKIGEQNTTAPVDNTASTPTVTSNNDDPNRDDPLAGYKMPTVDQNYFELLCENSDITLYSMSTMQNFLMFQLISTRNLEGETVTVTSNFGGTAVLPMNSECVMLPAEVILAYQGIEWAELEGDAAKLKALRDPIYAASEAEPEALPSLYSYTVTLILSELGMTLGEEEDILQLTELTVTIGGQSKTYSLENIRILRENAAENENFTGLSTTTWAVSDYPAKPGTDGVLELPDLHYVAKEDIVLNSFAVPGAEVLECELRIITLLGDRFSLRWDGASSIEVDAGSEITVENVVIRDPGLGDKLVANVVRYIVVNYTMDGENYNTAVPVSIRMRVEPWDAYAWYVDGVDMLPYYMEYVNYNG